jgi:hypothetical protein
MGQIYANANRVLVWLGPDPENIARQTFSAIRSLARRTVEASDCTPKGYLEHIDLSESIPTVRMISPHSWKVHVTD